MFKTHRVNHDFQIAYFLAGKCHTPDAAYALMHDLKEDREAAIVNYHVVSKRNDAKHRRLSAEMPTNTADTLECEADLLELDTALKTGKVLYEAAQDELACINKIIAALEPIRKYKDLPDAQAFEKAQEEEWLYELIERAENMLFCHGVISPDHFATMRLHPAFHSTILPSIVSMQKAIKAGGTAEALMADRPGHKLIEQVNKALALPAPAC